jgi:eukaryotic-like serine/threonine-protein kinase
MAEIYKVKTVGLAGFEKIQALKRILPSASQQGRFIRSFIDEARIAVELSHRNIVQVFDFGKADGDLYLAMELIEGQDLRAAMTCAAARQVRCPLSVAAYIVSEVAAGLDYAHRKTDGDGRALGIVHCDMSPSNVMLSVDGYVKILDFGIARASFSSALERRRLRGKPRYMAPEQTRGDTPTAATDVFALGIIAWELVVGRALFTGTTLRDILHSVLTMDAPPLQSLVPDIPAEMADAVAIALQREPKARGTASDLCTAWSRAALMSGPRGVARWQEEIGRHHPAPAKAASLLAGRPSASPVVGSVLRPPSGISFAFEPALGDVGDVASHVSVADVPMADLVIADLARGSQPPPGVTAHREPLSDDTDAALPSDHVSPENKSEGKDAAARADDFHAIYDGNEDAIDDRPNEFPMDSVAALVHHRRIVVVVALLDGAAEDTLRVLSRSLADLAYQRGGVMLTREDRAITAAFGLEVAGEDDVAVAMTWAVDASVIARDAAIDVNVPQLRVGGRAGATATLVPGGPPQVATDAIDEARSLAKQAQPDRPLFVGGTGRLSSALFSLREVAIKRRRSRSTRALEVVGLRTFDEPNSALFERRGRFVGRQRELATIGTCVQRAISERRRVIVLLHGASGVGKSRFCAEFAAQTMAQSNLTGLVVATAGPATRLAPFGHLVDFLQAVLRLPAERGRGARDRLSQRLRKMLRRGDTDPAVIKAVMGDLERAMELRDGTGVGAADLADLRARVTSGLTVLRRSLLLGRRHALGASIGADDGLRGITILENIHHTDSASLESIRDTLSNRETEAELFVLTTQSDPPAWPFVDQVIELRDLVGAELRSLAVDRLAEAATPLNVAAVISRAGGTPLFIEELAAALRIDGKELPGTARDVIAARVDRLSPAAKTAARYAAVLGETVRARLLEELIGQGDISEVLEELIGDGLLERRDAAAPECLEGEISFARGLFREVVYDGLSSRALRDAHARVGRLLVARFFAGREEPPALIAEHLEKGGEVAAAAAFWLRAGRLALSAADAETAVTQFSQCLELEAGLGESPPGPSSRVRRREALLGREEARRLQGDLQSNDSDLAALGVLCEGQPRRQADLANRLAHRQLRRGDYAAAMLATLQAEQMARSVGDERLRALSLRLRGEAYEAQGSFDQALSFLAQACTIFRRHGYLADEISAMVCTGRIHLLRAHYEAARDSYSPVVASIQKTGDPWLERIVRNHLAVIEMCLGNFSEAMVLAKRSIELCRRYGDRAREGDTLSVTALILSKVGLYDQAAATFTRALDMLTQTSSRWSRADCLISAGMCDVLRGHCNGIERLDEAISEARQLGARYLEANGLVARAGARLHIGDANAAIADAEAGAAVARRATLVGCEITGLARHALALYQIGDLDRAVPLAKRALALLDVQHYLEGSEEEILQACGNVLCAAGETERGQLALSQARAAVTRKLAALLDPSWQTAYAAIAEHRQLLREN